jgi:hypothetical protein
VSTEELERFVADVKADPQLDESTNELRGDSGATVEIELARVLAARHGLEIVLRGYRSPTDVMECLEGGECDIAFLGYSPARAAEVGFSPPFLVTDQAKCRTSCLSDGCLVVAQNDGRHFDGQPSLSGHSGSDRTCSLFVPVAIYHLGHLP